MRGDIKPSNVASGLVQANDNKTSNEFKNMPNDNNNHNNSMV